MRFLFRVDAGGKIGLGHFYRSLNLAKHLKKRGHEIIFAHKVSDFWKTTSKHDFPFHEFTITKEIDQLTLIDQHSINVFYVDGNIEFDEKLIDSIKQSAKVVFYQNLSASRNLADIYILPSIHQQADFFNVFSDRTELYVGLKYFTFSEDIENQTKKKQTDTLNSVAIIAGGSDPKDVLRKIFSLIHFSAFEDVKFYFYYGNDYTFRNDIPKKMPLNCQWLAYNADKILKSDLLISAFGVSTYEFLALGMPVISVGHQKTNAYAADHLAENTGGLISLGFIDNLAESQLNQNIEMLSRDDKKRKSMSLLASKSLDLQGIERIINILESLE